MVGTAKSLHFKELSPPWTSVDAIDEFQIETNEIYPPLCLSLNQHIYSLKSTYVPGTRTAKEIALEMQQGRIFLPREKEIFHTNVFHFKVYCKGFIVSFLMLSGNILIQKLLRLKIFFQSISQCQTLGHDDNIIYYCNKIYNNIVLHNNYQMYDPDTKFSAISNSTSKNTYGTFILTSLSLTNPHV